MHSTSSQQVADLGLEANTSCVLIKKQIISIEPMPMPVLKDDGVLVKVMASGICGSDMHAYLAGGVGGRPILSPTVMGHEAAGEVIAVGSAVTTHKAGDRVAIEPGLPCRTCANCKNGRSNICSEMRYCGAPGTHGTLSRYFTLPADMAPHFPSSISWDEAGSIQPLAIGVQIGKRAELGAHQTLAIFGCGPIGLITAAVAHAYSARKIIAFDISPSRVDFAKKYRSPLTGKSIIDHVFLVDSLVDLEDRGLDNGDADHHVTPGDFKWEQAMRNMSRIIESCGLGLEGGVGRVIEASGAEDAMLNGVAICKPGGIYLQVGLGHIQTHLFPTIAVTNKDLDVRGITRYTASCFPSAIDLLARGAVDLKSLITAKYEMSRAGEALEAVRSGKEIKVIIRNQEV
ncbi:PKS-ER domain-containing protein [Fusarium sp. Ph1]|nr:PKS-ER domain-containing protein [Fusarium sp. Ph1]